MRSDQGNFMSANICPIRSTRASAFMALLAVAATGCNLYYGSNIPDDEEFCANLKEHPNSGEAFPTPGGFPLLLGETVKAADPPPPISGGTLTVAPGNAFAVAGDSDRDQVYIIDLQNKRLTATIPLQAKDEPGRVIIDDTLHAYIALRNGGAVAVVDIGQKTLVGRYALCPAPRGLALDSTTGLLWVACHGGELVRANAATGEVVGQTQLDAGLRDVVIDSSHVYVSIFRTAELLVLDREGQVQERMVPPVLETKSFDEFFGGETLERFIPGVAWRTIANPNGGVLMLHQRARKGQVSIQRGGYGGFGCEGGIVHATITSFRPGQEPPVNAIISNAVLPADLALVENAQSAVVVSPANQAGEFEPGPPVMRIAADRMHQPFDCTFGDSFPFGTAGQPVAVASMAGGNLGGELVLVQSREPAQLIIYSDIPTMPTTSPVVIELSAISRRDTGHQLFHLNSGTAIACASCHPEGADDGKVWEFQCIGPRRTQSLQFGLLGTEPFHWDGDMNDFGKLMTEVFVGRMGGGQPNDAELDAMSSWLDKVKAPPRSIPSDAQMIERGRVLFNSTAMACSSCHVGAKFTDNKSYDVGTGGTFQVPSLIGVANRAPYIHTGCAPTLLERFTDPECGGGDKHGFTSKLNRAQIDDLIAFLKTL